MIKNVSSLLTKQAEIHPYKKAICYPKRRFNKFKYTHYNFITLDKRINKLCHKLESLGVKPGDKVLFFVKPNLDFCAITFALFRIGATVVFIDPGMKREYFLNCIKDLKPDVLIGITAVHIIRQFFKSYFQNIRLFISTTKFNFFGEALFRGLDNYSDNYATYIPNDEELAAILFTSGGTGKPKGVEYGHDIFINQTKMLQEEFNLTAADTDIPGFPLFSFFTLAMGMTSVIPAMNPAKPAKCNPKYLYQNIMDSKASFIAGSPSIWERLGEYCANNNLTLPSVKYVVMFGAPVKERIHRNFSKILPNGTTYTPYGATECLPIANITGKFILEETIDRTLDGQGICVGTPFKNVEVKIIQSSDDPIKSLVKAKELGINQIGEIIVHGPSVTKAYYSNIDATVGSKIIEQDKVWHRMGDMGYLDDNGRLWFCGRKKHTFSKDDKVFYPVMIEEIFNQHPKVKKTALIKNSNTHEIMLVVEPVNTNNNLISDLENFKSKHEKMKSVSKFIMKNSLPVDTRHNIKIDRTALTQEYSQARQN